MMEEASPSPGQEADGLFPILVADDPPTTAEELAAHEAKQDALSPAKKKPAAASSAADPTTPSSASAPATAEPTPAAAPAPAASGRSFFGGLWSTAEAAVQQSSSMVKSAVDRAQEATKQVDVTGLLAKTKEAAKAARDATLRPLGLGPDASPINVVLTSAAFPKVNAVREALDRVFGFGSGLRAVPVPSNIALQPVGFAAGRQGAENRIDELGKVDDGIREGEIAISIENCIVQPTPGQWFDVAYVILMDDQNDILLETMSQAVSVPPEYAAKALAGTPKSYEFQSTGYAVTVGQLMKQDNPEVDDANWHITEAFVGRNQLLHVAVLVLFGQYRKALEKKAAAAS